MSIYSRNYGKEENKWLKKVDSENYYGKDAIEHIMDTSTFTDLLKINISDLPVREKLDFKDIRKIISKYDLYYSDIKIAYEVNDNLELKVNDDDFDTICKFIDKIYKSTRDLYQPYREVETEDVVSFVCRRLNNNICTIDDIENVQTRFIKEIAEYLVTTKNEFSDEQLRLMAQI